MTDTFVTVSPASLWSPRPVVYHAYGSHSMRETGHEATSDALTACGKPHYRSVWRIENGQAVAGSDRTLVSWPQIHVAHARRIGRPCSRCFPEEDQ